MPKEQQKGAAGWATWTKGKEFYFYVFANAYTEWQKGVKAPVRPNRRPLVRWAKC